MSGFIAITEQDIGRHVRRKSTGDIGVVKRDPGNGWLHPSMYYEWQAVADDLEYVSVVVPGNISPDLGAMTDILAERKRQVSVEGYSPEHDDRHDMGELAGAAASYAISAMIKMMPAAPHELQKMAAALWLLPDEVKQKHPPLRMLEIAGALILAEIERLRRRQG